MSERQAKLLALAGELADDFATRAAQHDREASFPVENVERMKETGYTALVIPERNGGLGADLIDYALCQERLARGCAATALSINMHLFGLGSMVERSAGGPRDQLFFDLVGRHRRIIGGGISEPETGGDWGFFATRARRDGNRWVLNGRKAFTSLSPVIDIFMVMATIEEDSGPPASATFAVPRGAPGAEIIETWDTMAMRATASHDLILKDVRLGEAAMSERRPIGPIDETGISLFAWFSVSVAAIYTGIAQAALKFACEFAGRHRPMTLPRPISYLPGTQFAMAEAQALLAQSRALFLQTGEEYVRDPRSFAGEEGLARVVMPKYVATNNAVKIVDLCMEMAGAHGLHRKFPLERHYRDVRAGPNHPLSNARARELIGKAALGVSLAETPRW